MIKVRWQGPDTEHTTKGKLYEFQCIVINPHYLANEVRIHFLNNLDMPDSASSFLFSVPVLSQPGLHEIMRSILRRLGKDAK